MNKIIMHVRPLDKPFGYILTVNATIAGEATTIEEHYDTENAVRDRLAAAWTFWANQVDAEA